MVFPEWFPRGWLAPFTDVVYLWILVPLLVGAGIYFSARTGFVQLRRFGSSAKLSLNSPDFADPNRAEDDDSISGFGAFCAGLAARTGTGNIAGIGVALVLGGPGAMFWMWVVALLSMGSSVVENTLGQLYKVPAEDGTFRGGPAFYIERGLGSKAWAKVFAVLFVVTVGLAFVMIQANTITDAISGAAHIDPKVIAVPLAALSGLIVLRGVRRVTKLLEVVTPWVAGGYIVFGLMVVFANLPRVPEMFGTIVQAAFGIGPAVAGLAGALMAAIINGARRGLFSNEAGQGQAPNAAATASTPHPVDQGLSQSFGVFVCTFIICTLSAFIVLLGAPAGAYQPGSSEGLVGAQLVSAAGQGAFGEWGGVFIVVALFLFGYTTVLGNYSLTEGNMLSLGAGKRGLFWWRIVFVVAILVGSLLALETVWAIGDIFMAAITLINLIALIRLFPMVKPLLQDWEAQFRAGKRPVFDITQVELPREVPGDVWLKPGGQNTLVATPEKQGAER